MTEPEIAMSFEGSVPALESVLATESRPSGGSVPSLNVLRSGLGWSFLNTVLTRLGSVATGIVIARLLAPDSYGTFATALLALNALLSINELGVSLAIVRWPGDVRKIAPTVATLSLSGSALLYLVCLGFAPAVASALHAPDAVLPLRLICLCAVLDGLLAVPSGLLMREYKQRSRLWADGVNLLTTSGMSIALVAAGHGATGLAIGYVVGHAAAGVVLVRLAGNGLRFGFDRSLVPELLRFGVPLALASLLVFAMLNVDYVVVGATLGPVALGLYYVAFNLSSWPVNVFSVSVRRVALAGFSRLLEDPERASRRGSAYATSASLLMALTLPTCVLLGVLARPAISVLYGEVWVGAAPVLPFLAAMGAVRVFTELAYDYTVAAARSRTAMALQALWLAALIPALIVMVHLDGIRGAGVGHAGVALLIVVPAFFVALRRNGVPSMLLLSRLARPLIAAALCGVAAGLVEYVVLPASWPGLVRLMIAGTAGIAAWLPVIAPLRHSARSADELSGALPTPVGAVNSD